MRPPKEILELEIGITLRNMGVQSTPALMQACAKIADEAGLDSLWITDHVAIPPDDAEGSGGRYLDPLIALSWIAGFTRYIKLGTGVLVLPYRPAHVIAKSVATLQELSGNRLLLGVGIGWMDAEFKVVGVPRVRRGRVSDDTLSYLRRCFESDEMEANGQKFLFLPRPQRPPILIGGRPPHAFERALIYGDGWIPMGARPETLKPQVETLRAQAANSGRPPPEVVAMTGLPLDGLDALVDRLSALAEAGATQVVAAVRYDDAHDYEQSVDLLSRARDLLAQN
jgi:probable F420-dependent oxidoreductase